mmetsp:Transcript_1567/g.4193  ORF Transcript_1567/g.4193 Transcript_1567/m.4193 type:complete len:213 (-) Transcript_1567:47-685(-)
MPRTRRTGAPHPAISHTELAHVHQPHPHILLTTAERSSSSHDARRLRHTRECDDLPAHAGLRLLERQRRLYRTHAHSPSIIPQPAPKTPRSIDSGSGSGSRGVSIRPSGAAAAVDDCSAPVKGAAAGLAAFRFPSRFASRFPSRFRSSCSSSLPLSFGAVAGRTPRRSSGCATRCSSSSLAARARSRVASARASSTLDALTTPAVTMSAAIG